MLTCLFNNQNTNIFILSNALLSDAPISLSFEQNFLVSLSLSNVHIRMREMKLFIMASRSIEKKGKTKQTKSK